MKKLILLATVASLTVLGLGIAPASAAVQDNVGVCHRTASESNPYVFIEVPPAEANGHITGTSNQHNQKVVWPTAGTWRGIPHAAGDLRLDYLAPGGEGDCTDEEFPPPTGEPFAFLSTPTCADPRIFATGVDTGKDAVTFDVFINGVLIDAFIVGGDDQAVGPGLEVDNGDVVTVRVLGSEIVLVTETVVLNCVGGGGGGGGGGAPCPGSIHLGGWYGDPRVNIDLKGDALFVVRGGIQRFTNKRMITADLACGETLRIGRYKVSRGHHLRITQDGVLVVNTVPPRLR